MFITKRKKKFYEIARSSLVELDTQLELSKAVNIVPQTDLDSLGELMNKVFAKISCMKKKA